MNVQAAQSLDKRNIKGVSYVVFSKQRLVALVKASSFKFSKDKFFRDLSFQVFKSMKFAQGKFIDVWSEAGRFLEQFALETDFPREDFQMDLVLEANKVYKLTRHNLLNPENWTFSLQKKMPSSKKIYVVLPVGIPGLGKTHYIEKVILPSCAKLKMKPYVLSSEKTFERFSTLRERERGVEETRNAKRNSEQADNRAKNYYNLQFKLLLLKAVKEL